MTQHKIFFSRRSEIESWRTVENEPTFSPKKRNRRTAVPSPRRLSRAWGGPFLPPNSSLSVPVHYSAVIISFLDSSEILLGRQRRRATGKQGDKCRVPPQKKNDAGACVTQSASPPPLGSPLRAGCRRRCGRPWLSTSSHEGLLLGRVPVAANSIEPQPAAASLARTLRTSRYRRWVSSCAC